MIVPDISSLKIDDPGPAVSTPGVEIPDDIASATTDRYMVKLRNYCKSLPYTVESNARIQEMLEFILLRITQCVEAKDYDPGLQQWDSMLT